MENIDYQNKFFELIKNNKNKEYRMWLLNLLKEMPVGYTTQLIMYLKESNKLIYIDYLAEMAKEKEKKEEKKVTNTLEEEERMKYEEILIRLKEQSNYTFFVENYKNKIKQISILTTIVMIFIYIINKYKSYIIYYVTKIKFLQNLPFFSSLFSSPLTPSDS
jgi:hypothetical protein